MIIRLIKSHHGHPQTTEPGRQSHNYPLKTEQNIGPEKETYNRNLIAGWSISITIIHICQKKDGKPHNSIENRTTPSVSDNTVKILRKHTVRKGRHKPTLLVQPATTILIHGHCMNTREECSMQNQYKLNRTKLIQKWIRIDTVWTPERNVQCRINMNWITHPAPRNA